MPPTPGNGPAGPDDVAFLTRACELAAASASGSGGPFGALVVRDGAAVATGTNRVTTDDDPTAHAEVVALRAAGRALGTHDLSGCVLYASCEPCPMCAAAAWWSRVDRVVFAASASDAADAGFDDGGFWAAMRGTGPEPVRTVQVAVDAAADPFLAWAANPDRVEY